MPLQSDYVGKSGDMCRCGRVASREHCPVCGSFKVRYRSSLTRKVDDPTNPGGRPLILKFWACLRCGTIMPEESADKRAEHCEAPKILAKTERVVMELSRTRSAIEMGHPLTDREEVLAPVVMQTRAVASAPTGESELPAEVRRKIISEYVGLYAKIPVSSRPETMDEYIIKRSKEMGF